jgi:hypothetical protein
MSVYLLVTSIEQKTLSGKGVGNNWPLFLPGSFICEREKERDLNIGGGLCYHESAAPVAQLDRALDFGSSGCGFESCQVRPPARTTVSTRFSSLTAPHGEAGLSRRRSWGPPSSPATTTCLPGARTTCLAQRWRTQVFPFSGGCDRLSASTGNHLSPGEARSASHLVPALFSDAPARIPPPFWGRPPLFCYGCPWQTPAHELGREHWYVVQRPVADIDVRGQWLGHRPAHSTSARETNPFI